MGNKGNSPVGLFRRPIRILAKQLLVKLSHASDVLAKLMPEVVLRWHRLKWCLAQNMLGYGASPVDALAVTNQI